MWAAVVVVSAFVGLALIWWSISLGFTFFVLPILVCELVLFGALYVLRQGLGPEDDPRETESEWQMAVRYPRPEQGRHSPFQLPPA